MFLSFNNYTFILKHFIISFILIIAQSYLPTIKVSNSLFLYSDLLLIYLTYLSITKRIYIIIIIAFFVGIFQDLIIQNETVGLYSLLKVLAVYSISYLNKVKTLWNMTFKYLYLLIVYFLHYFIYHFIFVEQMTTILSFFILFEAILNLFLFIVLDKVLSKKSSI